MTISYFVWVGRLVQRRPAGPGGRRPHPISDTKIKYCTVSNQIAYYIAHDISVLRRGPATCPRRRRAATAANSPPPPIVYNDRPATRAATSRRRLAVRKKIKVFLRHPSISSADPHPFAMYSIYIIIIL